MSQIFVCKGCGASCYYATYEDGIKPDDIRCPKQMPDIKASWQEIKEFR
jgi:hypothetical protein